jgi:hypothetical protein
MAAAAPRRRRAAERRLLDAEAVQSVERLDLDARDADPSAALRSEMRRTVASVETLDAMASDLPMAAFLTVSLPPRRHLLDVARTLVQLDPDGGSEHSENPLDPSKMTPSQRCGTMRAIAFTACQRAEMSIVDLLDAAYEREIASMFGWADHMMRYDSHKKNGRMVNDVTRFEALALIALGMLRRLGLGLDDLAVVAAIEGDLSIDIVGGVITRRNRATSQPINGPVGVSAPLRSPSPGKGIRGPS